MLVQVFTSMYVYFMVGTSEIDKSVVIWTPANFFCKLNIAVFNSALSVCWDDLRISDFTMTHMKLK